MKWTHALMWLAVAVTALGGCTAKQREQLNRSLEANRRQVNREVVARRSQVTVFSDALGMCPKERRDAFELDAAAEYSVGRTVAARHLTTLDAPLLPPDHPLARYVDRVGQVVALSAELNGSDTAGDRLGDSRYVENRPWPLAGYRFLVIDSADPNAYGLPGGTVMISTGLLKRLESEEELAAVLAHEVAHVQRGHGVEVLKAFMCQHAGKEAASKEAREFGARVEKNVQSNLAGAGLKLSRDKNTLAELLGAAADASMSLFEHGYPDENELEADRMALRHLVRAGYEARALRAALERLSRVSRPEETYAKTHPPFTERLSKVGGVMATLPPDAVARPPADVSVRTQRFLSERNRPAAAAP